MAFEKVQFSKGYPSINKKCTIIWGFFMKSFATKCKVKGFQNKVVPLRNKNLHFWLILAKICQKSQTYTKII
ncbi:hypothetical protein C4546_03490 [Candidatus Parcubacteria bacterium]|nr:MAG: hypothetical protein C4546_03490 [Candidatus Parcubacteria bacterium]